MPERFTSQDVIALTGITPASCSGGMSEGWSSLSGTGIAACIR